MSDAKDLTKQPPRSPKTRIGGYVILARCLDKGRAMLDDKIGDYHFDCPLDNMLFHFKGVKGSDIKSLLETQSSDDSVAAWLDKNGLPKSAAEVKVWSDGMEAYNPTTNPDKKDWFVGECKKLNIDPYTNTLFDWLDADDRATYAKK